MENGVEAAAVKNPGSTSLGGHPMPQMYLTDSPFPKARFLTGTDKELGSSTSSDTEEDPLPANKCKKVRGPDPAVPSARASALPWRRDKCTASEKWAALGLSVVLGPRAHATVALAGPGMWPKVMSWVL